MAGEGGIFTETVTSAMELLFDDDSIYNKRQTEVIEASLMSSNRLDRLEHGGSVAPLISKLTIGPSKIPNAGSGVITNEAIPALFCVQYIGRWIPIDQESSCDVSDYRWTVFKFDEKTGMPLSKRETAGFVDGLRESESNWARFVNCSPSEEEANLVQWQEFGDVFYGTKRPIEAGEELMVWYGAAFARVLGLKV